MLNKIIFTLGALAICSHGVANSNVVTFDKVVSYNGVEFSNLAFAGDCADKVRDYALGKDADGNPEFIIYFKKGWVLERDPNETEEDEPTRDICQLTYRAKIDPGTTFKFTATKITGEYTAYRGHDVRFKASGALGSATFDSLRFRQWPKGDKTRKSGLMEHEELLFVEQGQRYPCGGERVLGSLNYVMSIHSDGRSKPALGHSFISVLSAITQSRSSLAMPLKIDDC